MTCAFLARRIRRSTFALPTTCSIIRMCRAPAATMTSASLTFAQQSPNGTAPSTFIWRWAMAGHLWPFVTLRTRADRPRKKRWRVSRLCSMAARSMTSRGVSRSSYAVPGGGRKSVMVSLRDKVGTG